MRDGATTVGVAEASDGHADRGHPDRGQGVDSAGHQTFAARLVDGPGRGSTRATDRPESRARIAAASPTGPPPTTRTSNASSAHLRLRSRRLADEGERALLDRDAEPEEEDRVQHGEARPR